MGDILKKFIILLILTFLIGVGPSIFVSMNIDYLNLPSFYPPTILFPIVWTILYILMTISIFLATKNTTEPYKIYFTQLAVNGLWSVIFFGLKLRLFAFIWILLLLGLVIIMIYEFKKESKLAAYLQIPYVIWLVFAGYLNLTLYLLNR